MQDAVLHALEHFTFIAIAVLFWLQVIDPYPFHSPLRYPLRIVFLFVATAHNTALGLPLTTAELEASLRAVSREDLQRVAQEYLSPERLTLVVVAPGG